jgi:hypothetical protein
MFISVLLAFPVRPADLLASFALCPAFPDSATGRYSRDYYEATAPPGRPTAGADLPAGHPGWAPAGGRRTVPTFTTTSIDQVGVQLYPDSIATATPQTFTDGLPTARTTRLRS